MPNSPQHWDVVVMGGSLAGAATALLLRSARPDLSVLVLEKSTEFPRRVGEATVEISAYFLGRVLGLTQYLNNAHMTKQGMRFWLHQSETDAFDSCSEIGGRYLARVPSWQVDRSTLDEELLRRAVQAGVSVLRGAKVRGPVLLQPGGSQTVPYETAEGTRTVSARWVVDATGFTCALARQQGWYRRNDRHPTTAVWARWRGVRDWDGLELSTRFPAWAAACRGIRGTATNHFVGDGWWAWCIPLRGGDWSIGVVFDQRKVSWPRGPRPLGRRLKDFLCAHPVGRELLEHAEPVDGDVQWRANLAYVSEVFATDGAVLVGDAAAFIDPLYSPGMDWLSYTVVRAVDLILDTGSEPERRKRITAHNRDFRRSYDHWFEAIYRDKYEWIGDFDLLTIGFRLDLSLYYTGIVSQPFSLGPAALRTPVFSLATSDLPFRLMHTYNRRLATMARARRERGCFGKSNLGHRCLLNGYLPERSGAGSVLKALGAWMALECREGWRTWLRSPKVNTVRREASEEARSDA